MTPFMGQMGGFGGMGGMGPMSMMSPFYSGFKRGAPRKSKKIYLENEEAKP